MHFLVECLDRNDKKRAPGGRGLVTIDPMKAVPISLGIEAEFDTREAAVDYVRYKRMVVGCIFLYEIHEAGQSSFEFR